MTYNEILNIVAESEIADWNVITCWGSGSGPSYKDKLENHTNLNDGNSQISVDSHGMYACYKPNVSISIAFGLRHLDYFNEDWANIFPDSRASSSYFDIFYNNTLVERLLYVVVDGGRAKLPIPESVDNLEVGAQESSLIRLVDSLESGADNYERYFRQAGFSLK